MSNKMFIDASHPEETRVVVTKGSRIEEFDFESEHKKQLKGNIYLARVTRVEPSLQAAFVEYGGNRHGFLAFSEIHPDYYQIPAADRRALLEAEERHAALEEAGAEHADELDGKAAGQKRKKSASHRKSAASAAHDDAVSEELEGAEAEDEREKPLDLIGAEDALEEVPARPAPKRAAADKRDYKIQEVIKRRQILLVQVVKEERGNKGAALTTYLSLAGRYSVLMPNTARGGGISRKITNMTDRKRLKDIVKDLAIPRGMGIILRTAGAARTKTEVRRDYEYLMRLWENVRALTLTSMAPALVYEEGSLIKRSIRDLYNKDIDEILVAGDKAYREAKDFMRMLMPSHAKFVQPYRDLTPIFARRGIEAQLDGMLQPEVGLKSGGYLVMNQTEALVAIDVNSGRSTREHSVEETALQTNLEAAEEVARQLRLRDLAGLIVIDFIDMQEKRNIRAVEKRLKDCLKDDRARIQLGHISHFGLMEMSRQRIRASVLESTTQPCPHCLGRGYVRSQSSLALHLLRVIEEHLLRSSSHNILVKTPSSTALYALSHKKRALIELEDRFGVMIDIQPDDSIGQEHLAIHKTTEAEVKEPEPAASEPAPAAEEPEAEEKAAQPAKDKSPRSKQAEKAAEAAPQAQVNAEDNHSQDSAHAEDSGKKRRRRGRRGGRRNRDGQMRGSALPAAEPVGDFSAPVTSASATAANAEHYEAAPLPAAEPVGALTEAKPRAKNSRKRKPAARSAEAQKAENTAAEPQAAAQQKAEKREAKPSRRKEPKAAPSAEAVPAAAEVPQREAKQEQKAPEPRQSRATELESLPAEPVVTSAVPEEENSSHEKKKGWWSNARRGFF